MDTLTYEIESEVEKTHWWFVGRRKLLARIINGLGVPRSARVLDIGTSTGTNLRMLGELGFARFEGLDASEEAIRWCAEKRLGKVTKGGICDMPFPDASFDLVLATDVIEHVEDDARALAEIHRVLKPGAAAILTVPAFQLLWGRQDEVAHHKRRYRADQLLGRVAAAGLVCRGSFYFNYVLFLPILAARRVIGFLRLRIDSENQVNTPIINSVLTWIFGFDIWSAPLLRPPFGVSFLAVVHRRGGDDGL
jgi:SAM-dependent methyltransferase